MECCRGECLLQLECLGLFNGPLFRIRGPSQDTLVLFQPTLLRRQSVEDSEDDENSCQLESDSPYYPWRRFFDCSGSYETGLSTRLAMATGFMWLVVIGHS